MSKPVILIVEDQQSIRRSIIRTLGANSYNFIEAESGSIGLFKIKKNQPDLVILDIMMPGMTGHEMLRKLQDEGVSTPKVLMLSSLTDEKSWREGLEEGAIVYMTKPFKPAILRAQVRLLLHLRTVEEEQRTQKRLILQLLHEMQPFLIGINKELGNAVDAKVQNILERTEVPSGSLLMLHDITQGVNRARNDLHQAVRILDANARYFQLHGHVPDRIKLDLNAIVNELVTQKKSYANKNGIELVLEDVPVSVNAEEWLIRKALDVLIHYAIGREKEGGVVCVSPNRRSGYAEVRVRDTGPAISKNMQEWLYADLESKDENPTHEKDAGMALVRRIAGIHGGRLDCESESGKNGVTFIFSLDMT